MIGAVGATVFVLANRGSLERPWPLVSVACWGLAAVTYLVAVLGVRREFPELPPVSPRSGLTYVASVAAMLALIWLGSLVLGAAGREGLRPALIVAAVGLHFLPFARAFHAPVFRWLGALMTVLGLVGLALGWALWDAAAAAVAVATGVLMLAVVAFDALRLRK